MANENNEKLDSLSCKSDINIKEDLNSDNYYHNKCISNNSNKNELIKHIDNIDTLQTSNNENDTNKDTLDTLSPSSNIKTENDTCTNNDNITGINNQPKFKIPTSVLTKVSPKEDKLSDNDEFKIPITQSDKESNASDNNTNIKFKIPTCPVKPLKPIQKCSYKEPKWASLPEQAYSFEVLKGGKIVQKIDLSKKSFNTIGRLVECDIKLDHPSLSRFHAVMQYGSPKGEGTSGGLYIYDLGSVHGTFVNKILIKSKVFIRIRVGFCLKFAGSSRLFILQGPDEDREDESASSITELKELREQQSYVVQQRKKLEDLDEKVALEEADRKRIADGEAPDVEKDGISWGMADDKTVYSSNVRCVFSTPQDEQLYLADPKKTLRGYFEREGLDMPEYQVTDGQKNMFKCVIELPLDDDEGHGLVSEVEVGGKKRDAIVQCALQACRILDMYGELRKAKIESRARKRHQKLEDDDDDDDFLDRTGDVQLRRERRLNRYGRRRKEKPKAKSHTALIEELEACEDEIKTIKEKLEKSKRDTMKVVSADMDALDAFMCQIKAGVGLDTITKTKHKHRLVALHGEKLRLQRLVKLSAPLEVKLLSVNKPIPTTAVEEEEEVASKGELPLVSSDSRTTTTFDSNSQPPKTLDGVVPIAIDYSTLEKEVNTLDHHHHSVTTTTADIASESGDSLKVVTSTDPVATEQATPSAAGDVAVSLEKGEQSAVEDTGSPSRSEETSGGDVSSSSSAAIDQLPGGTTESAVKEGDSSPAVEKDNTTSTKAKNPRKRVRRNREKDTKKLCIEDDVDDEMTATWIPPIGQKGDGRTALNDKYGY